MNMFCLAGMFVTEIYAAVDKYRRVLREIINAKDYSFVQTTSID